MVTDAGAGRAFRPGALRPAKIAGLSTYVPPRVLTNADLEKLVETSDEWILQRTGIRERHLVDPGIATSDLAKVAAQGALAQIYLASRRNEPVAGHLWWIFWIAQGAAILIKGPIAPLLSALTIAVLFAFERDGRWLAKLRVGRGLLLVVVILGLIDVRLTCKLRQTLKERNRE